MINLPKEESKDFNQDFLNEATIGEVAIDNKKDVRWSLSFPYNGKELIIILEKTHCEKIYNLFKDLSWKE